MQNKELVVLNEHNLTKFWDKIIVNPGQCWQWTARRDKNGYGIIQLKMDDKWVNFRAPRMMWVIENDRAIPKGMQIQHKCDNPECLNPDHLQLGDHRQNALDRELRRGNYHVRGQEHCNAILTNTKVKKICELFYCQKMKIMDISKKMEITRAMVSSVVRGRTWKHITKNFVHKYQNTYQKIRERNELMYQQHMDGKSIKKIAKENRLCADWVYDIIRKIKNEKNNSSK